VPFVLLDRLSGFKQSPTPSGPGCGHLAKYVIHRDD
jgi:hypothetical protein